MTKLSLSKAWEETRAVIARDGRLLWPLGLAFMALPGLIVSQFMPTASEPQGSGLGSILLLVSLLIGLTGQLAIQWLALSPGERVADAIQRGARAMPRVFAALLLVSLPAAILASPLILAVQAKGAAGGPAALGLLIVLLVALFVLSRLLLTSPVAVAEQRGIVAIIKRSWQLTRGNALRLYLFVLCFFAVLAILSVAATAVVGSIVIALAGPPAAWSTSAILIALVGQVVQLFVSVPFTTMLARLYAQAAQGQASVPHAP